MLMHENEMATKENRREKKEKDKCTYLKDYSCIFFQNLH